jgi:transposase
LIIVADAGLLSAANINELKHENYEFILGARLKKERKEIQDLIFSTRFKHGESRVLPKDDLKLVVSYSDDRAKKDAHNRNKGLRRLEQLIKAEKLTKANINNKGYNKFLTMEGDIRVKLDAQKVIDDQKWDGLKGYLTNSNLTKEEIIQNYGQLWNIERAFRITKSELKIRPVYHRRQRRIEAHICLTFASYKIYKELERILKEKGATISASRAIEIALSIFELKFELPQTKERISKLILVNQEQKYLANLLEF